MHDRRHALHSCTAPHILLALAFLGVPITLTDRQDAGCTRAPFYIQNPSKCVCLVLSYLLFYFLLPKY
jgi:hypothetical protein